MPAANPPAARPLPAVACPRPFFVCGCCGGSGEADDPDFGAVTCPLCAGSGDGERPGVARFVLNTMHSLPRFGDREAAYDPNTRRLTVRLKKKTQTYLVREFEVAAEYGRGFELEKPDGECHTLRCGPAGVDCSCGGTSYASNGKANQRAFERGDDPHPSWGCAHLDSVVPLIEAGWFDLKPVGT